MATKTAMKSTRKGLVGKIEITFTADVIDHALAYSCKWEQSAAQPGAFVAPVWARTRTAIIRGLQPVVADEGLKFFTSSNWRDHLSKDEALACLSIARKLRTKHFPDLASD